MWKKTENSIYQKFNFRDFDQAFEFMEKVAGVARQMNHHPKITNSYNIVELELSTHSEGSVTEKDEQFAREIDKITETTSKTGSNTCELTVYTDGGSRGNPGPSATGIVIYDLAGNVVAEDGEYIGKTTNNQAEYRAILKALKITIELGAKRVNVFMDSELIIKQLRGEYKVKNTELLPHFEVIKKLESEFDRITYTHILREKNKIADALVNKALDALEK